MKRDLTKFINLYTNFKKSITRFKLSLNEFFSDLYTFIVKHLRLSFFKFESGKSLLVTALYRQRGRLSKRFMHTGMASLAALGMMIAPIIANEFPGRSVNPWELKSPSTVLSAATVDPTTETLVSEKVRDTIIEYEVKDGDTLSSIAGKFDITLESLLWQNSMTQNSKIKAGQKLEILPVTGVSHKVKKGDSIYTIAKRYDVDPQQIVNYPFNSYSNDETFELAVGQLIIVPEGVRPEEKPVAPRIRQTTPDAGTVLASGQFAWPTSGRITSNFVWYHPGVDIANKSGPDVLAADSGRVIIAGWPDNYGYGNRIMIDHGNGYKTLYAHLSRMSVIIGQTVNRGDVVGKMGSTGRSTGTHLHFEVSYNGSKINPLSVLK